MFESRSTPETCERQVGAGAEEIELFELHTDRALPARACEREPRIQSPDIARSDHDVDAAVLVRDWLDRRVVKIASRSQDARRLVDQSLRIEIAAFEQQLLSDHLRLRANVQLVRESIELLVLLRIF